MFLKSAKNELNISLFMLSRKCSGNPDNFFGGVLAVGGVSYMQLRDQSGKWITFCSVTGLF